MKNNKLSVNTLKILDHKKFKFQTIPIVDFLQSVIQELNKLTFKKNLILKKDYIYYK